MEAAVVDPPDAIVAGTEPHEHDHRTEVHG
jgi:hypothetical protein